jgi:hypothetical protein
VLDFGQRSSGMDVRAITKRQVAERHERLRMKTEG